MHFNLMFWCNITNLLVWYGSGIHVVNTIARVNVVGIIVNKSIDDSNDHKMAPEMMILWTRGGLQLTMRPKLFNPLKTPCI
jgi:hypothetical protein